MRIKNIIDEDFGDYKIPSMLIAFPTCCSFKCEKSLCQNSSLTNSPDIITSVTTIVYRYLNNNISHAIVCAGLEPFDSWEDLQNLIQIFRENSDDDIVIYTGYNKCEIEDKIRWLKKFKNLIIKFGRYIPNQKPHYDEVLGVNLASDNQYAEKIS